VWPALAAVDLNTLAKRAGTCDNSRRFGENGASKRKNQFATADSEMGQLQTRAVQQKLD
jgi:hypothetical protein